MVSRLFSSIAFIAMPLIANAAHYQIIERPRQQCWNEQVAIRSSRSEYGGAVLGGIAGALLGNQIGGGNGRAVATAIGAATGAIAGDRVAGRTPTAPSYQTVQRCRTVIDHVRVPIVYEQVPVYEVYPTYDHHEYGLKVRPQWRRKHWKHHRHEVDEVPEHEHHHEHGHGQD